MERSLIWSVIALGGMGWLSCLLAHFGADRLIAFRQLWQKLHTSAIWIGTSLPIIIFFISLPTRPPFSDGHGLGIGFLLGGAAALLGSLPALMMRRSTNALKNASTLVGGMWLTISFAGIGIFWNADSRMDILVCLAIGHCAVSTLLFTQLLHDDESRLAAPSLLLNTLFATTLSGITALGVERGSDALSALRWSGAALLMSFTIPLAIAVASATLSSLLRPLSKIPGAGAVKSVAASTIKSQKSRTFGEQLLTGAIGLGLAALLVRVVSARILEPRSWMVLSLGITAAIVVWLLVAEEDRRTTDETSSLPYSMLGTLVFLGAGVAAFSLMRGFGQGLLALGAIGVAGLAAAHDLSLTGETRRHIESRLSRFAALLALPVVWVLFRVIQARFGDTLRTIGLSDHFALIGFVLGITLPTLATAISSPRNAFDSTPNRVFRLVCAAIIVIGLPAIAMLLWKGKIVLALISGFAISSTGLAIRGNNSIAGLRTNGLNVLWSIAGILGLCQFSNRWIAASSLTREGKMHLMEGIIGGALLLLILVEFGSRYRELSNRADTGNVEVAN